MGWSILLLGLAFGGCASTRWAEDARFETGEPEGSVEAELDELILLLADRKIYDSFTVTSALTSAAPVRARLADALGRTGTAEAVSPLLALLADDTIEVRRRAAFGLGVLGDERARPDLEAVALDADRELGRLAVEAMAKIGAPLAGVQRSLATLSEPERWARLAPALHRWEPDAILETAVRGFGVPDPMVRRQLIYALARDPISEGLPILRTFTREPEPVVRAWIARALGLVGDRADVAWLLEATSDADGVAIQAVGALAALVGADRVTPGEGGDWAAPWLALSRRDHPGPRAAALAAAGAWPADVAVDDRLYELATSGSTRELELGLAALAKRAPGAGRGPLADAFGRLLTQAVASDDATLRAAAARVAATLGLTETVEKLAFDEAPGVRMAVHEVLLSGAPDESAAAAVWILRDRDDAVRAATLEWLAEQPRLPVEVLATALEGYSIDAPGELVVDLARAVAARAEAEPLERGLGVDILESLGQSSRYVVRRAAFEALDRLGRAAERPEPAVTRRMPDFYLAVSRLQSEPRYVDVQTEHGSIRLELDCPAAPITCSSFLQLVRQGFYDGLRFHRVVPDFVVQTGDPRGDGWGGPGFDLRAERNRLRYDRGVLGMADSGLDTAGSQIFLTLAPQPHLDGRYTAFGRTIAGDAILDEIEQGDVILSVREVEP